MKALLNTTILAGSIVAILTCQAQVYSINGRPVLPPNGRPGEVRLTTYSYSVVGQSSTSIEWYVSTNVLANQPRWDGLSAELPLSVQRACLLALPFLTNRFPQVVSWSVDSVSLSKPYTETGQRYADVWYYQIAFTPRDPTVRKQTEGEQLVWMQQIVLLDGTVVPPRQVAERSKSDGG